MVISFTPPSACNAAVQILPRLPGQQVFFPWMHLYTSHNTVTFLKYIEFLIE